MISVVQNVAIDCADAYGLARFWSEVTGCPLHPEDGPGAAEAQVQLAEGPALYFNQVPEPKVVKNRIHLCLRPDTSREPEVERLLSLGATLVSDRRQPDGSGWAVLADPEGNEFCVLRSASDRAATERPARHPETARAPRPEAPAAEPVLRPVQDEDLPLFFAWMSDPEATRVAAFTAKDPTDRAAFDAHWARIRSSSSVVMRTVVADGTVVGHVGEYGEPGDRRITYWIDRAHWGRGLATAALRAYLDETPTRPLHARAAADNLGSRRVLEKCGFVVTGADRGFAQARGEEVDEVLVTLHA